MNKKKLAEDIKRVIYRNMNRIRELREDCKNKDAAEISTPEYYAKIIADRIEIDRDILDGVLVKTLGNPKLSIVWEIAEACPIKLKEE